MTREEAIAVFKAFMDNPLFSDVHKAAFSIAMHDIKSYHKWNLNELVLTQKDNEQELIIDKIRAEIEKWHKEGTNWSDIRLMEIENIVNEVQGRK